MTVNGAFLAQVKDVTIAWALEYILATDELVKPRELSGAHSLSATSAIFLAAGLLGLVF